MLCRSSITARSDLAGPDLCFRRLLGVEGGVLLLLGVELGSTTGAGGGVGVDLVVACWADGHRVSPLVDLSCRPYQSGIRPATRVSH